MHSTQQGSQVKSNFNILFSLLICILLSSNHNSAKASGFRLPESSIAGIALSNAIVANNKELGALAYNPAAMSFHEGMNLVTGLSYLTFDLSVTPVGGTKTDNIGKDSYVIPNLYVMDHINNDWSWGLAINTPFGLETKWPDNTFPSFAGIDQLEVGLTKLEVLNYNPNIAYRLDEYLSVAIGINYYDVQAANLNSQSIPITGTGHHHGWTVAFLQEAGDLNFGFSYRTPVHVSLKGTLASTPVTAGLDLPSVMQFGFHYQFNNKLAFEFDIERTGWSKLQDITIRYTADGSLATRSTYNWENSNAYRFGMTYDLSHKTQLRFGYALDKTPIKGDAQFSARTPDSDRQTFSFGLARKMPGWLFEASYMYVLPDGHTESSTSSYTISSPPQESNGTSAYNGNYEADGHILGLGLTKSF
ncbi:MAG: outer membrane protein transport protein [Gammaproteobacteria bacterium]|nr:outer membrane protein transport protein [Gammaproteobacteria bacterium]